MLNLAVAHFTTNVMAQDPTAAFTLDASFCLAESLDISNTSTDASTYEWDFCVGDFEEEPDITSISQSGSVGGSGYDIVQYGSNWYGFGVDRNNRLVNRFDYGNSPLNEPVKQELTIADGTFTTAPEAITVIEFDGEWHAVVTYNGNGGNLIRLDFGTSPDNDEPDVVNLGNYGNTGRFRKAKLIVEDGDLLLLASDYSSKVIWTINYSDSFDNSIDLVNDIFKSNVVTGLSTLTGFDIKMIDGDYIVHAVALNGTTNVVRLNYGNSLMNTPTQETTYELASLVSSFHLELVKEGNDYIGIISSSTQAIKVYNFGDLTAVLSPTELTYSTSLPSMQGLTIVKQEASHYVLGVHSTNYIRTIFDYDCAASQKYSAEINPDVNYSISGDYDIELVAYNSDGDFASLANTVTITSDTAPDISFTVDETECITEPVTFTPSNVALSSYEWSFDNGTTIGSTTTTPDHTFSQSGDSTVILTVSDGTCTNTYKTVKSMYPEPATPTFFDSGAPYCTGGNIEFTNLFDASDFNGANLNYTWDYNGEGSSNERDGAYTFDTEGTKTITLTITIPGCSTTSDDTDIEFISGPAVDFSFENQCFKDDTEFSNLSSGAGITGQTWDFGDSNGSSDSSPTHEYSSSGDYEVSLTVQNSSGCSNVLTQAVTIDDTPSADFEMGVGCEGIDVQFEDATTVTGANIDIYTWDFGGEGSSDDSDPTFAFNQKGDYDVTLTVESTYGCTDEITKTLSVQLAPEANFDIDLGCVGSSTQFLDQTETEIENPVNVWYWEINGDIIPNTQNPVEVFDTPGDYTASLTVTPSNLCANSITKNFTIHEIPIADFSTDQTCDNKATQLIDASYSATTTITDYSWQIEDVAVLSGSSVNYEFTEAGDYKVSLTVTDEVGCEHTTSRNVTINTSPIAAFEMSKSIGEAPLLINFTNQSSNSNSYLWNFNDGNENTSTETDPEFTFDQLGDYNVELIAINEFNCTDTLSALLTVADPVLDLELLKISSEDSESRVIITLSIQNSGNVTLNGFDIRIDLDNNSSVFERYAKTLFRGETIDLPLNFTFSSTDSNIEYACINLISLEEEFTDVDIVNNELCIDFEQTLIIEDTYPNPVTDGTTELRLNLILPNQAPVQIFLVDPVGNLLYHETHMNTSTGLNSFFLNIQPYKQGLYFIKIIYENSESTQRFVKF